MQEGSLLEEKPHTANGMGRLFKRGGVTVAAARRAARGENRRMRINPMLYSSAQALVLNGGNSPPSASSSSDAARFGGGRARGGGILGVSGATNSRGHRMFQAQEAINRAAKIAEEGGATVTAATAGRSLSSSPSPSPSTPQQRGSAPKSVSESFAKEKLTCACAQGAGGVSASDERKLVLPSYNTGRGNANALGAAHTKLVIALPARLHTGGHQSSSRVEQRSPPTAKKIVGKSRRAEIRYEDIPRVESGSFAHGVVTTYSPATARCAPPSGEEEVTRGDSKNDHRDSNTCSSRKNSTRNSREDYSEDPGQGIKTINNPSPCTSDTDLCSPSPELSPVEGDKEKPKAERSRFREYAAGMLSPTFPGTGDSLPAPCPAAAVRSPRKAACQAETVQSVGEDTVCMGIDHEFMGENTVGTVDKSWRLDDGGGNMALGKGPGEEKNPSAGGEKPTDQSSQPPTQPQQQQEQLQQENHISSRFGGDTAAEVSVGGATDSPLSGVARNTATEPLLPPKLGLAGRPRRSAESRRDKSARASSSFLSNLEETATDSTPSRQELVRGCFPSCHTINQVII